MEKEKQNKKKKYIIGALLLILIIVFILIQKTEINPLHSKQEKDKTLDFIAANDNKNTITLPAVEGLYFTAQQTKQTVNFTNPNQNVYFVVSLYLSDDTMIFQSDLIPPLNSITEIELNQTLEKGIYKNCRLVYDCFDENRNTLNSAEVIIELNTTK